MREISFVICTFQGLFGMVPAMYVDLAPDRNSCIWTPSMWLTLPHVVSMEVMVVLVIILFLIRAVFSVAVWVVVVVNINLVDPNTGHSKSDLWPSILCFCCCS